jgi:hypothetical protein
MRPLTRLAVTCLRELEFSEKVHDVEAFAACPFICFLRYGLLVRRRWGILLVDLDFAGVGGVGVELLLLVDD